jgi:hypothetical protein
MWYTTQAFERKKKGTKNKDWKFRVKFEEIFIRTTNEIGRKPLCIPKLDRWLERNFGMYSGIPYILLKNLLLSIRRKSRVLFNYIYTKFED